MKERLTVAGQKTGRHLVPGYVYQSCDSVKRTAEAQEHFAILSCQPAILVLDSDWVCGCYDSGKGRRGSLGCGIGITRLCNWSLYADRYTADLDP